MNITKDIRDMRVGEVGYTMDWAIFTDDKGELRIRDDYPADPKMQGTMLLKVRRTNAGVEVNEADYKVLCDVCQGNHTNALLVTLKKGPPDSYDRFAMMARIYALREEVVLLKDENAALKAWIQKAKREAE